MDISLVFRSRDVEAGGDLGTCACVVAVIAPKPRYNKEIRRLVSVHCPPVDQDGTRYTKRVDHPDISGEVRYLIEN